MSELFCVTIFRTNLHLREEYTAIIYIRWLYIDGNVGTAIVPPSTLI